MQKVVDFHAHVYPGLSWWAMQNGIVLPDSLRGREISRLRDKARTGYRALARMAHDLQPQLRHFSKPLRDRLDLVGGLLSVPGFLLESGVQDLRQAMLDSDIDACVVIAHPPYCPNNFVLELAAVDSRIIPVVNIGSDCSDPAEELRSLVKSGARALKIHPSADGERENSKRYLALLEVANELALPVFIHTGCIHLGPFFKDPEAACAGHFESWFERFPNTIFNLAHMNYHDPDQAIDLARRYDNVTVETSWQPGEVMRKALSELGPRKVLFGSDWPIFGANMAVGLERVKSAVLKEGLSSSDGALVMGGNALRILGISSN
jgi:predicted TIM-barrel fold metal-dependent hydrolase